MANIPRELLVFLVSALPVAELRAGIPLGLGLKLNPWTVLWLAVLGNLAPVIPILVFLEPASKWLTARSAWFDRALTRLFEKTRQKHSDRIERYGAVGLAVFVAIPSPGTGAWSGCLVAWLFGIHLKYSIPAIAAGVLGAAAIVMAVSTGALAVLKFFENPLVSVALLLLIIAGIVVLTRYRNRGKAAA